MLAEFTFMRADVGGRTPPLQKGRHRRMLDFQSSKSCGVLRSPTTPHLRYNLRPRFDGDTGQVIQLRIDGREHEFSSSSQLQHPFSWKL
jgi:hypothetical protein